MPQLALPMSQEMVNRLAGHPFLVALDVDGTLAPIARRPENVAVPAATRDVIERLVALPGVHVALLSGRAAADATAVVGVSGTWTIGNHGLEVGAPGEQAVVRPDVMQFARRIAAAVERSREIAAHQAGVIVEDKRWTASVHYRLADPDIIPDLSAQIEAIASEAGLRVTHGKKVFELRPPIDVDKGVAAVDLADHLGALHGGSVFCAGDDHTDEDAFRALREACTDAVTVLVGDESATRETAAEFFVADPDALRDLLETIVARRTAAAARSSA